MDIDEILLRALGLVCHTANNDFPIDTQTVVYSASDFQIFACYTIHKDSWTVVVGEIMNPRKWQVTWVRLEALDTEVYTIVDLAGGGMTLYTDAKGFSNTFPATSPEQPAHWPKANARINQFLQGENQ